MTFYTICSIVVFMGAFTYTQGCFMNCKPGQFFDVMRCRCLNITRKKSNNSTQTCKPLYCHVTFKPCVRYYLDKKGCRTCRCKCEDLRLNCPSGCKYGTELTKDEHDCEICVCKRFSICPKICDNYCLKKGGYKKFPYWCEACACLIPSY
ncbi:cysteine-rich motor neuron 1 protein [Plakobranchus ocellatus]|uniref:Cysteine-rich motor neuron 1 protein n=1 Tax=Plakobranchus ocellatus TaxID=259542 RepID=A0AAV3ZGU5_9GAST|nr:cysteine-rich motor neuron 1 protein [Plakobranchus ocellatus]